MVASAEIRLHRVEPKQRRPVGGAVVHNGHCGVPAGRKSIPQTGSCGEDRTKSPRDTSVARSQLIGTQRQLDKLECSGMDEICSWSVVVGDRCPMSNCEMCFRLRKKSGQIWQVHKRAFLNSFGSSNKFFTQDMSH